MIDNEASVFIANDAMAEIIKSKSAKGKLVRVAEEGFYEVRLTLNGKNHTAYLPVSTTVLVAAQPDGERPSVFRRPRRRIEPFFGYARRSQQCRQQVPKEQISTCEAVSSVSKA